MRKLRLAFLGLGNVTQAFLKLLPQRNSYFFSSNIRLKFVGVATRTRCTVIDLAGIVPAFLIDVVHQVEPMNGRAGIPPPGLQQTAYATVADLNTIVGAYYATG